MYTLDVSAIEFVVGGTEKYCFCFNADHSVAQIRASKSNCVTLCCNSSAVRGWAYIGKSPVNREWGLCPGTSVVENSSLDEVVRSLMACKIT